MSRKIFLKRSQTQMVPEVEMQEVLQYEEVFTVQMTELTYLRSALIEQKETNFVLEEQLKRATENQLRLETTLIELEQQLRRRMCFDRAQSSSLTLTSLVFFKFDTVPMPWKPIISEENGIGLVVNNAVKISGSQGHSTACDERRACGGEIQEISSNDEHKHELAEHLGLPSEDVMELESSHSARMGDVRPHLRTANREDKFKQTVDALRLKKRQVHLTRKNSEAPLRNTGNTPQGRKQSKTHSSTECGKDFIRKSQLITHLRTHTGEKPFKCTDCGVAFNRASNLSTHQMTHTGVKPFECQICNAAFNHKSNLTRHQGIHKGAKTFKCQICSVAFSQKSNLTRHLLIHANAKPFVCDICSKSYRRKQSLSEHQNTHSGRRPYQCNVCKGSFRQQSALSEHRRIHAQDKLKSKTDISESNSRHLGRMLNQSPERCNLP